MNESSIDNHILSCVGTRWKKVARVIVEVADAKGGDLAQRDDRFKIVADRIETLVRNHRLVAQGDTKKWRFSEVRQPN
jgi:Protein of unknown function